MKDQVALLKEAFLAAEQTRSPIVLDLDGDGITTLGHASKVYFDHDGNGFAELTGWVGPQDGLLVLDRDANRTITSGAELFGNMTPVVSGVAGNGFVALRQLDGNSDGRIDSNDTAFAQLRVWRDANSNGRVDAGELLGLVAAGVRQLNLSYVDETGVDEHGNQHLQVGSFVTTEGVTRTMTDVWFKVDTSDTVDLGEVALSAEIAALPDLGGAGNVASLRQAMARDASGQLRDLVTRYVAESDAEQRSAMVIEIVYRWAGVFDIDPLSRAATQIYGNVIGDARKLAVLEAFIGDDYVGIWCWGELDSNPHGPAAAILLQAFNALANFVSIELESQTRFADLYALIDLTWNTTLSVLEPDVTRLVAELTRRHALDEAATHAHLAIGRGTRCRWPGGSGGPFRLAGTG